MNLRHATLIALTVSVLAACAGTRPPSPPENPTALPDGTTPAQIVAAIRAAGTAGDDELSVQPLRANEVEDQRRRAAALEGEGRFRDAAAVLDGALATHDADPTVLQERAEVAILLWDFDGAASFARRAIERGADVGPLCRRHWATLEHVARARLAQSGIRTAAGSRAEADAQEASAQRAATQARVDMEQAKRQREACTVAPPARY